MCPHGVGTPLLAYPWKPNCVRFKVSGRLRLCGAHQIVLTRSLVMFQIHGRVHLGAGLTQKLRGCPPPCLTSTSGGFETTLYPLAFTTACKAAVAAVYVYVCV